MCFLLIFGLLCSECNNDGHFQLNCQKILQSLTTGVLQNYKEVIRKKFFFFMNILRHIKVCSRFIGHINYDINLLKSSIKKFNFPSCNFSLPQRHNKRTDGCIVYFCRINVVDHLANTFFFFTLNTR